MATKKMKKTVAAAHKAWETRRANEKALSKRALKAWATRRKTA